MSLKPERELHLLANLDLTRRILDRSFRVFLIPLFAAYFVYQSLLSASASLFPAVIQDPAALATVPPSETVRYARSIIAYLALTSLYSLLTLTLAGCVVAVGVSWLFEEKPLRLGKLVTGVIPRVPVVVAAGLVSLLVSGVLSAAFLLPGLIAMGVFSLLAPVVVLENRGVVGSLKRCIELARGRLIYTAILFVCLSLFSLASSLVSTVLVRSFGFQGEASLIPYAAVMSLVAPLVPISWTVHYYSLLARAKQASA